MSCPAGPPATLAPFGPVTRLAPPRPRGNSFPGEVIPHPAADTLDWRAASRADPLPPQGRRGRFLPETTFRGRRNAELHYAALAAAAIHDRTGPA